MDRLVQPINIVIICALKLEAQGLKTKAKLTRVTGTPFHFFKGAYQGISLALVICGIGKIRSAAAVQWAIDYAKPDIIINWGSAGGVAPDIKQGDIIASSCVIEHDFYASSSPKIPANRILLDLACLDKQIQAGILASADQNINTKEQRQHIWREYKASACDWESAAVLSAAAINRIPALSLRVITDIEERLSKKEFITMANRIIARNTHVLLNFINKLKDLNRHGLQIPTKPYPQVRVQ